MVKFYYFDADKTVPKYRLCEGKRCEIARLPKWKRSDYYTLKEPNWKITNDVENNDKEENGDDVDNYDNLDDVGDVDNNDLG